MRSVLHRMILLCLAVFVLVCTGCETKPVVFPDFGEQVTHGERETESMIYAVEDTEFVYEITPISVEYGYHTVALSYETIPIQGKATVYDDRIFIYALHDNDDSGYLLEYSADGALSAKYPIHEKTSGLMNRALTQMYDAENGLSLRIGQDDVTREILIYRTDMEENDTKEVAAIPYQYSSYSYFTSVDSDLYLFSQVNEMNHPVYFLNRDFALIGSFLPSSMVISAHRLEDGRVIAVCENGECLLFDEEKRTLEEIRLYEPTEAWNKASQILYGEDGSIYFINQKGITVQKNGEDTFLCDFNKSYLSLDAIQFVDVLSENRFVIVYDNPLTGEKYLAILAPTDAAERPMRQIIRVASIGTDEIMGQDYDRAKMIDASVAHFNMTDENYFIELTNFDKLAHTDKNGNTVPGDTTSIRDKLFEEALLSGEKYDVYLIGDSYEDRDMLVEKGLFEDLTNFAERKRLIRCVRDAMTRDGQITGIPFSVELSTLVTSTDILPAGTPFTYDKLIEIYENLDDGEALFCDYTGREMRQSAMYDFIDFENKTCSFDSAEFAEVFGFLANYEAAAYDGKVLSDVPSAYLDRTVGSFSGHAQGVTAYGDIIDAFAKGDIKFLQLHIGAPDTLSSMLKFFDLIGKDYNLCGYPSKDGGTVTVSTPMLMSIGADCENRSGAYRYLSLLLSDLLQTQDAMYAFPVTETAVETRLTWGMQYYYLTQESGMYTTRNYGSALRIQFGKASKSGLDSLKASYYDDTLRVLKPEIQPLLDYVCNSTMRGASDTMIRSIIEEELSYVSQGVRTAAEAGKIIQSRVFIYINE